MDGIIVRQVIGLMQGVIQTVYTKNFLLTARCEHAKISTVVDAFATVAQPVEQLIRNQQVGSSSLPSSFSFTICFVAWAAEASVSFLPYKAENVGDSGLQVRRDFGHVVFVMQNEKDRLHFQQTVCLIIETDYFS